MKYGYFDDTNREYVIDRPDTPAPWVNYLGSPEYGAIISNNAGGYSFAKSGANGRILRYIFNNFDQPGRYRPSSPKNRLLTDTSPSSCSLAPTTSMYGTRSRRASRIL